MELTEGSTRSEGKSLLEKNIAECTTDYVNEQAKLPTSLLSPRTPTPCQRDETLVTWRTPYESTPCAHNAYRDNDYCSNAHSPSMSPSAQPYISPRNTGPANISQTSAMLPDFDLLPIVRSWICLPSGWGRNYLVTSGGYVPCVSTAGKKIWDRLNDCYASPEVIETTLFKKLDVFPKISNKDYVKQRELGDQLMELQSAKKMAIYPG